MHVTDAVKLNGDDGQLDFRLRVDIGWGGPLDNFVIKILVFFF